MLGIDADGNAECKSLFEDEDGDQFTTLTGDCDDRPGHGELVHPSASPQTTERSGGGFDWNCDGVEKINASIFPSLECPLVSLADCSSRTGSSFIDPAGDEVCGETYSIGIYACHVVSGGLFGSRCTLDLDDLRSEGVVTTACR